MRIVIGNSISILIGSRATISWLMISRGGVSGLVSGLMMSRGGVSGLVSGLMISRSGVSRLVSRSWAIGRSWVGGSSLVVDTIVKVIVL